MNADLAAQRAMDRLKRDGFDALTETERTLASVWQFAAGVSNGGFAEYYSSSRGDLAFYVPTALRSIGAVGLAQIATEANALFGAKGPSPAQEIRQRELPSSAAFTALDRRYFACEEDVDDLLEAILR